MFIVSVIKEELYYQIKVAPYILRGKANSLEVRRYHSDRVLDSQLWGRKFKFRQGRIINFLLHFLLMRHIGHQDPINGHENNTRFE